jgi:hypothetical protein
MALFNQGGLLLILLTIIFLGLSLYFLLPFFIYKKNDKIKSHIIYKIAHDKFILKSPGELNRGGSSVAQYLELFIATKKSKGAIEKQKK